jgi:hypothetical protein
MTFRWISLTLLFILSTANARAGIVLTFDLDRSKVGVQNTIEAANGDVLSADILMEINGSTQLSYFSFSIRADSDELTFLDRARTGSPLAPLSNDPPGTATGSDDPVLGSGAYIEIHGFDGATTGTSATAGLYTVGTVNFRVDAVFGDDTDIDIVAGLFNRPMVVDLFADQNDAVITDVTFGNASVTVAAVPEPNLLGACFVALPLWTMRRRRSI